MTDLAQDRETPAKGKANSQRLAETMRRFTAKTEGQNRLGLRELCEAWCNDQWVAAHMTPDQAAESLLDCFQRAVRQELELLEVDRLEE
jgi:hypothetical protein